MVRQRLLLAVQCTLLRTWTLVHGRARAPLHYWQRPHLILCATALSVCTVLCLVTLPLPPLLITWYYGLSLACTLHRFLFAFNGLQFPNIFRLYDFYFFVYRRFYSSDINKIVSDSSCYGQAEWFYLPLSSLSHLCVSVKRYTMYPNFMTSYFLKLINFVKLCYKNLNFSA